MADKDNKDQGKKGQGKAGAEDPKQAAPKPATPKPETKAKTAPKRRRPRASKAAKDKAPDGKIETTPQPVPVDEDPGPGAVEGAPPGPKATSPSMKIRALGVGLVLAIVVGAGGWFTLSAWLERPAGDGATAPQVSPPLPDPVIASTPPASPPPPDPVIASTPPPAESTASPAPEAPAPEAPGKIADQSGGLKVTVDDLSGRLKTLEQRLQSATAPPPSVAPSVAPPSSAAASAAPSVAPPSRVASAPSPPLPPMLALLGFHNAIVQGAPFAAELATVERSFAGNRAVLAVLAPLRPWSGRGVATVARLQTHLEAQIPVILRAARPPVDDSGPWLKRNWARSWERLRALVVIRRVGEDVPGTAPDAIIARAEAILAKHDVAGAVTELIALKGAAAAAARDWLAQARARLAADGALAAITDSFTQPPEAMSAPAPDSGNRGRR